jgi:AcrR family transcriptional regulator
MVQMANRKKIVSLKSPRTRAPVGDVTRQLILDAAERLFAEQGPEAVSIRGIAAAANVNLAAVNYHFGTKERLFEELFRRLVVPMNEQRLALLEERLALAKPRKPIKLEAILEAFITPPLSLAYESADGARSVVVMQFLSHSLSKPGERDFLEEYYESVRTKFISIFCSALPHLSLEDVLWRYNYLVGGIIYAMGGASRMTRLPKGLERTHKLGRASANVAIAQLVTIAAAGFRAPSQI